MPRGVSAKREKEYEKLVDEFKEDHRYPDREKEVASRIVNKQRAQHGETKEDAAQDKQGRSPDKDLPISNYDKLDIDEIVPKLDSLSKAEIKKIRSYEAHHNNRKSLIEAIDRQS